MKNNIVATDNRLKRSPSSVEKSGNPEVFDEKEKTRSLNPANKRLKPPVIDMNAKLTSPDHLSNDELFKQKIIETGRDLDSVLKLLHDLLDDDPTTAPETQKIITFLPNIKN